MAGFGKGVVENPLVSKGLEMLTGDQQIDNRMAARLGRISGGSTAGKVGEVVGGVLPDLVGGIGAYALGRRATGAVVARFGAKGAQVAAAEGAGVAAEWLPAVGRIERTAMLLGGAGGIGGFEGARALAEGADAREAAKAAALGFALTAGFEGALVLAGRTVGASRAKVASANMEALKPELGKVTGKLHDLETKLAKGLKTHEQQLELAKGKTATFDLSNRDAKSLANMTPRELTREAFEAGTEFRHGTTPLQSRLIESKGFRGDVSPAARQYGYSEFGHGTVYAARRGDWWLKPDAAKVGRAVDYKAQVPFDFAKGTKIRSIRSAADLEDLATEAGFENWEQAWKKLVVDDFYDKPMIRRSEAARKRLARIADVLDIEESIDTPFTHHSAQVAVLNPKKMRTFKQAHADQAKASVSRGTTFNADDITRLRAKRSAQLGALVKQQEKAAHFKNVRAPKIEQEITRLKAEEAYLRSAVETPSHYFNTHRGGGVFNPEGLRLLTAQTMLRVFHTPEALAGKLGGVAAKMVFEPLAQADRMVNLKHVKVQNMIGDSVKRTIRNVGISKHAARKDPRAFLPVFNAYETGSIQGVRDYMKGLGRSQAQIDDQIELFRALKGEMETVAKSLHKMGTEPLMSADDLMKRGVAEYLPHDLADLPEEVIRKHLAASVGELKANRMIDEMTDVGFGKIGSFDFARVRNGSLQAKLDDASLGRVYESNPFVAVGNYLNRGHYRIEYGSRFGLRGDLIEPIAHAVDRDAGHGAGVLVRNILDQATNRPYYNQYMRRLSEVAINSQIATKLGLAVFPNMGQSANTIAFAGFRNSLRGLMSMTAKENRNHVKEAVGFYQGLQSALGSMSAGRLPTAASGARATALDKSADALGDLATGVLRLSGFTSIEAMNRYIGGAAGRMVLRKDIFALANGKLRGVSKDAAVRRLRSMDMTPDDITTLTRGIREGGDAFLSGPVWRELEDRAIYRAAQVTQFTPGVLRRPAFWTHPVGRVIFQFKTFALNQGRFMKDQVLAEAAAGNMKPLATILSIYPVAGEITGDMRALAKMKDRDKHGIARVVENYMLNGGIGIISDTYQSAQWGGFAESFMGPTVTTMSDIGENLLQGDVQGFLKDMARQPTVQFGGTVAFGSAALAYKAWQETKDYIDNDPKTPQELMQRLRENQ